MKIFLDTGAFLASADEDDDHHTAAKSVYAELVQSRAQFLTSNFVLSETYTLIRSKVSHRSAVEFMKRFDQSGIRVVRVSEANEQTAKAIFIRYGDKDFSFVDCTSFVLIDHRRLDHAFAFDTH
ncbi:MAG TPA: PIN domain-containing protein, partial [Candidatus Binatia bacterium]|nr:PIN domain-containing protein [Candidatus Binatia bacterium]